METPVLKDYLHPGCRIVFVKDTVYETRFQTYPIKKGAYGTLVSFKSLYRKDPHEVLVGLENDDDKMVFVNVHCVKIVPAK